MTTLIKVFLKIFFRNPRAWFFVIFLPTGLFALAAFLSLEAIIRADLTVPYRDFLLIGIISMAFMQSGIYTMGYLFIDYKRLQVLKRLYITPLSGKDFLIAQIISRFFISLLQTISLVAVGIMIFGANLQNFWLLPILVFVGSTLFLNFGVLIAATARDYEEAAPYTTIVGLPLVFLGDVFFPVQNLPPVLSKIADFLPLKPFSAIMRHYLLGLVDANIVSDFIVLAVWLAATILLAFFAFERKIYK
ncbi:MAG: ABC transporter permease [bacterium]|nr:ABC transporter permease [bacterium]